MSKIILDVKDERKASHLLSLLRDLDYVETQVEPSEDAWAGNLLVLDGSAHAPESAMYACDELHEQAGRVESADERIARRLAVFRRITNNIRELNDTEPLPPEFDDMLSNRVSFESELDL